MAFVNSNKTEDKKVNFIRTSSLNKYFLCHLCERKFPKKEVLQQHIVTCLSNRTCKWCSLVFKNRGNLVTHAYYIHNDKSVKTKKPSSITCGACEKSFINKLGLRYHIRSAHLNLVANVTSYDGKAVNEVWYETVENGGEIVEIKKSGRNLLLIRKVEKNDQHVVKDDKVLLDLTSVYLTGHGMKTIICDVCDIEILKRDLKKHYNEKHGKLKKHHCDKCNVTFKRPHFFLRHACDKKKTNRKRISPMSQIDTLSPVPV